jgi:hypothetical protein
MLTAKSSISDIFLQAYSKPQHLRPNPQPTNVKKIVEAISDHNKLKGGGRYAASAANFHMHQFAHNYIFIVLDSMRGNSLATWRYFYEPWEVRPIEVENILGLDVPNAINSYLVIRKQNIDSNVIQDPWCKLFRNLPESFWNSAEKITSIESFGRDGERSDFDIYCLRKSEFNSELLYDLAVAAEKVDYPQYKTYQKLKKIYYGLLYKKRPLDELWSEGNELLTYIKKDNGNHDDLLLNKKTLALSEKLSEEMKYIKPDYVFNSTNMPLINFVQVNSISDDGSFNVSGDDSQLYFDIPIPEKNHIFDIRVRIEVPSDTIAQLFYKPSGAMYSETLSQRCQVIRGSNECFFTVKYDVFDGKLRLDPGYDLGRYRLNEIAIFDSIIKE